MIPLLSWGGSILSMIISLKNNARPKKEPFEDIKKARKKTLKNKYSLEYKKVSAEKLSKINYGIRKYIENEDTTKLWNISLITVIICCGLAIGGILYITKIKENNARIAIDNYKAAKEKKVAYNYEHFISEGVKYLRNEDYSNARAMFQSALRLKPNNYKATVGYTASFVYNCVNNKQECYNAETQLISSIAKFGRTEDLIRLEELMLSHLN